LVSNPGGVGLLGSVEGCFELGWRGVLAFEGVQNERIGVGPVAYAGITWPPAPDPGPGGQSDEAFVGVNIGACSVSVNQTRLRPAGEKAGDWQPGAGVGLGYGPGGYTHWWWLG
jgi:hypothetical protein